MMFNSPNKRAAENSEHHDNRFGLGDDTVSFVLAENNIPKNIDSDQKFQTLFLLDSSYQFSIFQFLPRIFTITTRNGTSHFNYEMIINASDTILEELETNPTKFEYYLDIADEENVLEKFSQLFQGKKVKFNEDNLPISYKIVRTLKISKCPNFLKPYNLRTANEPETPKFFGLFSQNKEQQKNETEKEVVICQADFNCFIKQNSFKNFTIITQKKEYKCKLYAVYSSNVIGEFLKQNPEASSYKYDIEDEYEEFENINKIFNFERVNITSDNARSLDKMIKELEITSLYENIDNFRNTYDQTNAEINKEEEKIDEINEIISLLHNINENNFQETEKEIIKYTQNKDESEIQEFCSFLIQFVKTEDNKIKQELLSEILIDLDKESATNETLKILMPQFIKQLLFIIGITRSTCSFAYILYKKGKISKNALLDSIKRNYDIVNKNHYSYFIPYEIDKDKENNVAIYFLPELKDIQVEEKQQKSFFVKSKSLFDVFLEYNEDSGYNNKQFFEYLDIFLPDKLDVYKQMRDNGEPLDELTIALRRDDVDKLQQILSMNKIDRQLKMLVPYNIFEEYIENGETSCINYSAAYGSIKCFKYLLLNHHKIDSQTFKYAVYGGNIEIVKIVDQKNPKRDDFYNLIVPTIIKHQNDLFDWLFEQKFANEISKKDTKLLHSLMKCSVKNGNAHALIEIVDKGYDLASSFEEMIDYAAANGFYAIVQLIYNTIPKKIQHLSLHKKFIRENDIFLPCASFGNLSILKFYIEYFNESKLYTVYKYAITNEYLNIIKFMDNLPKEKFQNNRTEIFYCLSRSLELKSSEIFDYLLSNITTSDEKLINYSYNLDSILEKAIKLKKCEQIKKIIKIILSIDQGKDLSNAYIQSLLLNLTDVCQFLLDNKAFINYEIVLGNFDKIIKVDEKTFNLFINNIPPILKQLFIDINLQEAIENKNIHLIKYLFDQNAKSELALIEAVKTNDIKIVELVLKYFDLKFINESTKEGTALTIAVEKSNLEIVNKLLSIEGIDPSLVDSNNQTALNIAIIKQEIEICNKILDFYGENIKDQTSQLNKAIKMILLLYSPNNNMKNISIQNKYGNKHMFGNKSSFGNKMKQNNKIDQKMIPILKRILEVENVDLNCVEDNYSILSFACKINEASLVEYLLKNDKVKVNLKDPKEGNTALIVSILNENYDIAKMLIEHSGTDLNISNYKKETALTISVSQENEDIIKKIINNSKFEATKSRLDYAFYISSPKISKLLISSKTLDVNYLYRKTVSPFFSKSSSNQKKNDNDQDEDFLFHTKLTDIGNNKYCIENGENNSTIIELIDLIISHQSFDKEKSLAKIALFNSTSCDIEIFKKFLSIFENDVNILSENGQSLLVSAAKNKNKEVVHFLLNDPNFDCNKNEIIYAYVLSKKTSNIKKELGDFIKDHSQSIDFSRVMPNGKTPPANILGQID